MKAINLNQPCYFCEYCEERHLGRPAEDVILMDVPDGISYDEVENYAHTQWQCENGCTTSDDEDFTFHSETWQCGECHSIYSELPEAMSCCIG